MSVLDVHFTQALAAIATRGQQRILAATQPRPHGRLQRAGQEYLDFSSNDYLGLSQHPALIERSCAWTRLHGAGSGASRLVTGTSEAHLAVESRIARFKGTEAALLFASGWQANAAILPALFGLKKSVGVFADRLIHASMHHGCAAAGVRQLRYRHNDLDHLEALLAEHGKKTEARFILTESVFSMDGDRADLARLADIARRHEAFLLVDEAHATGVLGPGGAGLSSTVPDGIDLVMGTFSKAMGCFGAYVAGSKPLCDYLVNACGGFIFSTAPPPSVLGAIDAALDLVPQMDADRTRLTAMGEEVRLALKGAGFDTAGSSTHIVPVIIGGAEEALRLSRAMAERGIIAAAIRPPTVPPGTSRLRLALRSTHGDVEIGRLLDAIKSCR